ncbi:Protein of unknown function (DUF604 [Striga hermonthica]|uniref:Uncharacterized protein n=1 Tax=Striga hermonthica TaxID=68872 RepID=A0A9N7P267_STRHE|nr:Protein of unknown function (DUF604 [Striga hermonthica]
MSHSSETAANRLKPWKHLHPPPAKTPKFKNALLLISAFTVLYLLYFSAALRSGCPAAAAADVNGGGGGRTDLSHIVFAIGGSAGTWARRRHYCELWWRPNATRGHVWLDETPAAADGPWPETSPPYRVSADSTRFHYTNPYGSRSAVRIARILKESFEELGHEKRDAVRWFVMGDDDTVFFPENLVAVLNKYDHREMYYVGGNSESVEQDLVHLYATGYGGGGFAVSRPLAEALVGVLDGCIDRYADAYGSDLKIGSCINEIGVPITKELGFHQMDIRGSPYGLLSAHPIAPLVSLHHLDYIHPVFPGQSRVESIKTLMQAYNSDPSRTLQHTFCYDPTRNWSISVSWGYNVQLYPFLVNAKDLSTPLQTFLTWGTWSEEPFTFNTRAMSLEPCERPIVFFYDRVQKLANGTLTTYKTMDSLKQRTHCDNRNYARGYAVKGFNVFAERLNPTIWNKAPRRQCCEIMGGSGQRDGVVQVRIRACNQGESVTPP